ncbi:hypothetical protein [Clostridium rectalis]|uniref:hypothetical protein n=1 Tax=Clostridium rectalis TaxID=2040295 RepID=UPI000F643446|nr:hypothetical protein [Clostridium rectalis]
MGLYFSNTPDLTKVKENELMYKDTNGDLKGTGIFIKDNIIVSTKDLELPPNTLHLGDNIEIHENGGFIENTTNTLNKRYLLLDYQNSNVGTSKPIYYKREFLEINVTIQEDNSTIMNNITEINITPTQDEEVSKVYFSLVEPVTNFKTKLEVNGKDVAYYPSKNSWNDNTIQGYNLSNGIVGIDLKPHFSFLTDYNIKIYIKADNNINLNGNGTIPYLAVDRQKISKLEVVTENQQLLSNTHYVNQNKNDIQDAINEASYRDIIYVAQGLYDGLDININNKNELAIVCPLVAGSPSTQINNRALNITNSLRIKMGNLRVEKLTTIRGGTGRHYFNNMNFLGGLTIGNESNFIILQGCEFSGTVTINSDFAGVLYCINCNFQDTNIINNSTLQHVIITQCTNLPPALNNVYLAGLNSFSNMSSRLDVTSIYINGVNINNIFQPKQ